MTRAPRSRNSRVRSGRSATALRAGTRCNLCQCCGAGRCGRRWALHGRACGFPGRQSWNRRCRRAAGQGAGRASQKEAGRCAITSTGSPRCASTITLSLRRGPTRKPSMPTRPPPLRSNSGRPRRTAGRPGGPTSTTSACTQLCDRRVDHRERQDALDSRVVARQGTRERRVQPGRFTRSSGSRCALEGNG